MCIRDSVPFRAVQVGDMGGSFVFRADKADLRASMQLAELGGRHPLVLPENAAEVSIVPVSYTHLLVWLGLTERRILEVVAISPDSEPMEM